MGNFGHPFARHQGAQVVQRLSGECTDWADAGGFELWGAPTGYLRFSHWPYTFTDEGSHPYNPAEYVCMVAAFGAGGKVATELTYAVGTFSTSANKLCAVRDYWQHELYVGAQWDLDDDGKAGESLGSVSQLKFNLRLGLEREH